MRLARIELIRFGSFADVALDLGKQPGLHLVYGPNEAGKSTALRALRGLLFGIPLRTPDAHRFPMSALRVGATLENDQGEVLEVVRRKGNRQTLLDPDGVPLDDDALLRFMGGISPQQFDALFGLDHEALHRGGRTLVEGRGELADSLFSAASGGRSLQRTLADLRGEADRLFRPRATTRTLNAALRDYREATRRQRDLELRAGDYEEAFLHCQRLEADLAILRTRQRERQDRREHLEHIRSLGPLLRRLAAIDGQLRELTPLAPLPDDATEQRIDARRILEETRGRSQRLQADRRRIEEALAATEVPEGLLAERTALERFRDTWLATQRAWAELPALQRASEELQHQIQAEAEALASGKVGTLPARISEPGRAALDELRLEQVRLEEESRSLQDQKAKLLAQGRLLASDLGSVHAARDPAALVRAIQDARGAGDLDQLVLELENATSAHRDQVKEQLRRLGFHKPSIDRALALEVPERSTLERFQRALAENDEARRLGLERVTEYRARQAKLQRELDVLLLSSRVPTEADLRRARQHRDRGWQLLRNRLGGVDAPLAERAYHGELALPEAFQEAMREADHVVDGMRAEARRVARKAELEATLMEARKFADQHQAEVDRLVGARAEHVVQWQKLWRRDVPVQPPAEMRGWIERWERWVETVARMREGITKAQAMRAARTRHLRTLRRRMDRHVSSGAEKGEGHGDWPDTLERADHVAELAAEHCRERARLEESAAEQRGALAEVEEQSKQARRRHQRWQENWRAALRGEGLDPELTPAQAQASVEGCIRLQSRREELARLERQIATVREQQGSLEREFALWAAGVAGSVLDAPPDEVTVAASLARLLERLDRARIDQARRIELAHQLEEKLQAEEENEDLRTRAKASLDSLLAAAGVVEEQELVAAEERLRSWKQLRGEREPVEARVLELCEGEGVSREALVAESEAADREQVELELRQLRALEDSDEEELSRCEREIGAARERLEQMDGNARAAQAAADAEAALARAHRSAERYAVLRLGALILKRAAEDYRNTHQGPVLKRSGELLARLTCGSFVTLVATLDESDRPVLQAARPDGELVGVDGMSEGSRDQLFLALRLAVVERVLAAEERLPLILDDLLIQFDDRRAAASLEVLGQLSERTQVLLFTHHQHLVELANQTLEPGAYVVHELEPQQEDQALPRAVGKSA